MVVRATVTASETRVGDNLLRGVVPVAEGFSGPLFLRDTVTGNPLATEQHVGIRGAGAAVRTLELRAYAPGLPGGPRQFSVEDGSVLSGESFHAHQTFTLMSEAPDTQATSLATPGAVVTFSSRLLQAGANEGSAGAVTSTIIRSGEMTSDSGSRLFGWRASITTVAGEDGVWLVEMFVLNGNVGNPGSPLGSSGILHDVFFNEIRLVMPTGYAILHLLPTLWTTPNKLMAPNTGDKLHPIMQGGGKVYRFSVYAPGKFGRATVLLNDFGLFLCDHSYTEWSWSNPDTAWYGPHSEMVPEIALSGFPNHPYGEDYADIASKLSSGSPISLTIGTTVPLGPYHPWGPNGGQLTSGEMITAFRGYEVVNGGTGAVGKLKAHMALLLMTIDRSATKATPGGTGQFVCDANQAPVRAIDWNLGGIKFPNTPGVIPPSTQGPWPRHSVSQWRLQHAQTNNLLPGYYAQLGGFELISQSHVIRALGPTISLIWLRNDWIAKEYAAHLGMWGRMRNLEYGDANPSPGGALWESWEHSATNVQIPLYSHKGARSDLGGRIGGWAIFSQMTDWLATDDDAKRAGASVWLDRLKEHDELAQMQVGSKNWMAQDAASDSHVKILVEQYNINGHPGNPEAAAANNIELCIRAGAALTVYSVTGDTDWLAMLADACDGFWNYHWEPNSDTANSSSPVRPRDINGGDPWATRAEAPDCFSTNATSGWDNFQVGQIVLGALKHDPAHAGAWSIIYAFTGTSTPEAALDDLEAMFLVSGTTGDNNRLKMESGWGAVLAWLQSFTEGGTIINVTPSPAVMGFTAVAPDVQVNIEVTPSPAIMGFEAVPPEVEALRVDEIVVRPEPVVMGFVAVPPASIESGINVTPEPAIMAFVVPLASVTIQDIIEPPPAIMGFVAVPIWNIEAGGLPGVSATLSITLQVEETVQIATSVEQSTQAAMEVSQTLVIDYP